MGHYRLGVLEGDGIGPEVVAAAVAVCEAALARRGATVEWVALPMGWASIRQGGTAMPEATKAALAGCHGWIMGPHDSASYPPEERARRNPSGELRHHFDLYANIRPARSYPGVPALRRADLAIVRENTEGFYPDRNMYAGAGEWMPTPDVAVSVGVFTRRAAERIARAAFALARTRRRRVSIVHKANVIAMGTGLFRDTCRAVADDYPDVAVDDYHVDAMAAHLVRRAADFDVIVTTNMFGDILSDLAGELTGSLGLAPALNAGDERAMAQAAHGSAPDIAGRGVANPVGEILSAALLLDWLGARHADPAPTAAAADIARAVECALAAGARTPDLGGAATTADVARAVRDGVASDE
ncbi:MAG TPA: isocitrate/isopropylmalate family dehydrogenase [Thermomicrobiales bacterium]|nr:isocitrate/isopropylmalate family dehydrogenase [Thermomicrobiales bacterium]